MKRYLQVILVILLSLTAGLAVAQEFQLAQPKVVDYQVFFEKSTAVKLLFELEGATIHYTVDGSDPSLSSPLYKGPVRIRKNLTFKARSFHPDYRPSEAVSLSFVSLKKYRNIQHLELKPEANPRYPAKGAATLIDRKKASENIGENTWLGFDKDTVVATMQFDKALPCKGITLSYLSAPGSWIFPPSALEVYGGTDETRLTLLGKGVVCAEKEQKNTPLTPQMYDLGFSTKKVKYLKVIVIAYGKLPSWHQGAGKQSWLFVDEILLK